MSFDTLSDVNYLAALVAALAWFALGAIWYAPPVLGRAWIRAGGTGMPEGFRPNPAIFVATLVLYFVTAVAAAMFAKATGSTTFGDGVVSPRALATRWGISQATSIPVRPAPTTTTVLRASVDGMPRSAAR